MQTYDLIIIGSGSAGLPAGMYASRYKLSNLIIGAAPGGALATSHCVENYPGTISAPGREIMNQFREHAKVSGSEFLDDQVTKVEKLPSGHFSVETMMGKAFESRFLLLATGSAYRHLNAPNEDRLLGSGVSYCATCDGMFFRNRSVAVVGGGDTAVTEALYLSEICKEVHLLVRGTALRAEKVWTDQIPNHPNVIIHYESSIATINGEFAVEGVTLSSGETIPLQGVFVAIGSVPSTDLLLGLGLEIDEQGYVRVDARQATNVPGLYAAGDVTTNSNKFKQTIMSAAEGCLAAHSIHEDSITGVHGH